MRGTVIKTKRCTQVPAFAFSGRASNPASPSIAQHHRHSNPGIGIQSLNTWPFCVSTKGSPPEKKCFLSGIAQITSPPPPHPNLGKLYNLFWTSKMTFLCILQNQVTITTMMWVIIVIIILVLLMILVLKMTKKYHLTWYWCQNLRDSMVEKRVKKFGQAPTPLFGQCPN